MNNSGLEVKNMGNVKVRVNNDDENALTLDSNESGEISSTIYSSICAIIYRIKL